MQENDVILIPANEIASFCQRWKIRQLALFGSVLRDDFSEESDLDILVDFEEGADWGLLDHVQMQQELQALFQRNVDLISKRALLQSSNWLRRQEILKTAKPLFPVADVVDWNEAWKTATVDVPDLLTNIEPLLPRKPGASAQQSDSSAK